MFNNLDETNTMVQLSHSRNALNFFSTPVCWKLGNSFYTLDFERKKIQFLKQILKSWLTNSTRQNNGATSKQIKINTLGICFVNIDPAPSNDTRTLSTSSASIEVCEKHFFLWRNCFPGCAKKKRIKTIFPILDISAGSPSRFLAFSRQMPFSLVFCWTGLIEFEWF